MKKDISIRLNDECALEGKGLDSLTEEDKEIILFGIQEGAKHYLVRESEITALGLNCFSFPDWNRRGEKTIYYQLNKQRKVESLCEY